VKYIISFSMSDSGIFSRAACSVACCTRKSFACLVFIMNESYGQFSQIYHDKYRNGSVGHDPLRRASAAILSATSSVRSYGGRSGMPPRANLADFDNRMAPTDANSHTTRYPDDQPGRRL
jgi:hypothetical protein